jgi:hypothetical protein
MIEFKGSHFERDAILWSVRGYVAYPISYRQLEEMMDERGVRVVQRGSSVLWRNNLTWLPRLRSSFQKVRDRAPKKGPLPDASLPSKSRCALYRMGCSQCVAFAVVPAGEVVTAPLRALCSSLISGWLKCGGRKC